MCFVCRLDTGVTCCAVAPWLWLYGVEQLDFSAVIRTLPSLGYDDSKLDAVGEHIGFADAVTVEQLAAAGVPNRTVFDLRRRLDPAAAAAQVRVCTVGYHACAGG